MADRAIRLPLNPVGRYYHDESCIDCDMCRQTAPDNMARDEATGFSYTFKQPSTPQEEEQCREALEECPTDSIGDDGDEPVQPPEPGAGAK